MSEEWVFCLKFGVVLATVAFLHACFVVFVGMPMGAAFPWWLVVVEPAGAFVLGTFGQKLIGWSLR